MKTKIEENKKYKVTPKKVKGVYDKKYDVFTFCAGRGWENTQRYTVCEGQTAAIEIEVEITRIVVLAKKTIAECRILNKSAIDDIEVRTFTKKPYVRDKGSSRVYSAIYKKLGAIEGIYGSDKIDILLSQNIFTEI